MKIRNSLLDWKQGLLCDKKKNVTQMMKIDNEIEEKIVRKGDCNAGCQHFLLFPQCFQKLSYSESLKLGIVSYRRKASLVL